MVLDEGYISRDQKAFGLVFVSSQGIVVYVNCRLPVKRDDWTIIAFVAFSRPVA